MAPSQALLRSIDGAIAVLGAQSKRDETDY
jgi:hypothetical protein